MIPSFQNLTRGAFAASAIQPIPVVIDIGGSPDYGKIAVTSGTGYTGSTYTANYETGGQWYADETPISGATSLTYVLEFANEGKRITYRKDSFTSNSIRMWLYSNLGGTLKCWFDAASSSFFTFPSGTNVSQWNNRVVGAIPATQPTSTKYPVYTTNGLQTGYNAVVTNGTSQMLTMAGGFATANQTVLAVLKTGDTKSTNTSSWWLSPGIWGGEYSGSPPDMGWGLQGGYPVFGATSSKVVATTQVNNSQPMLLGYTRDNSNGSITHYYNAASIFTGTGTSGARSSLDAGSSLFSMNSSNAVASGHVSYMAASLSDFIICDSILSDKNRRELEGCAAWRWGIQSTLPVGHAFKNGPPGYIS